MSKDSDDEMNNGLSGETKRLGEWQMVVERVMTIAGIVVIHTVKELS